MARCLRMGLVVFSVGLSLGLAATSASADTDAGGPIDSDQSPPTASEVDDSAASSTPVSVQGQIGTYSTSVAATDELLSPRDTAVITSTAAGSSALTGVVIDDSTGSAVSNATIALRRSMGGSTTTTTSNSDGVFSFINIPADTDGIKYDLTVSANGRGVYTLSNDLYEPDVTYEVVVPLTTSPQTFDESQTTLPDTQAITGAATGYPATKRVPPTITVGVFQQVNGCHTGSFVKALRYPWKFYVLHVAVREIGTAWHQAAWKANAAAEQNYAWWFRGHPTHSTSPTYDIGNTTSWQCFDPSRKIPTNTWKTWLSDVNDERIATGTGGIELTGYAAGTYACSESGFPANGDKLSQQGSRALDDNCGYNDWRAIDEYYYTGSVAGGQAPPAPNTSFSRPNGAVKLTYPSQVKDAQNKLWNVGWHYTIEARKLLPDRTYGWVVIHENGWVQSARNVPTAFTYSSPGGCWRYRAKGTNPAGDSQYASFNGGNTICPG